jgi:hypothetical protein
MLPINKDSSSRFTSFEVIDAGELARRWSIPKTWILEQTRTRAANPVPCVRLGRYVRFEWDSPALLRWWGQRRK